MGNVNAVRIDMHSDRGGLQVSAHRKNAFKPHDDAAVVSVTKLCAFADRHWRIAGGGKAYHNPRSKSGAQALR